MESFKIKAGDRMYTVHWFDSLVSTNDAASEGAYTQGDVIVADEQMKGRGQRGNYWHSRAGENLTLSIVMFPTMLPAARQFLLSEAVSLAVADTLARYGIGCAIKWPNDIYVGDRKIAGILIENDICGANLSRSIIGIGMNVNEADFPGHLPNPVSMRIATGRRFDRREVLSELVRCLDTRYHLLESGGEDTLTTHYDRVIYRKDLLSRFRRPDGSLFEGYIRSVGPDGVLTVEHVSGEKEGFLFKEIDLLPTAD